MTRSQMSISVTTNIYKGNFIKMQLTNTYDMATNGTICGCVVDYYEGLYEGLYTDPPCLIYIW